MKRQGLNPKQWGASRSTPPPRLQDRAGVALGSAARRSSMRRRPAVAPAATAWSRSGLSDRPHGRRAHRPAGWRCGVTCGVGSRPGATEEGEDTVVEHLLPGVDVAAAGDEEQEDLLLVVKEDGAEVPDLSSEEEREAHPLARHSPIVLIHLFKPPRMPRIVLSAKGTSLAYLGLDLLSVDFPRSSRLAMLPTLRNHAPSWTCRVTWR